MQIEFGMSREAGKCYVFHSVSYSFYPDYKVGYCLLEKGTRVHTLNICKVGETNGDIGPSEQVLYCYF